MKASSHRGRDGGCRHHSPYPAPPSPARAVAPSWSTPASRPAAPPRSRPAGRSAASRPPASPRRAGTPARYGSRTTRPQAYQVVTSQRLQGLRRGTYTLRAWVRSSGDQSVGLPRADRLRRGTEAGGGAAYRSGVVGADRAEHARRRRQRARSRCTRTRRAGDWLNVDDLAVHGDLAPGGRRGDPGRRRLAAGQERGLRRGLPRRAWPPA